MIKILRRINEYTLDEFKQYCYNNGVDVNYYLPYVREWAIRQHEVELEKFISMLGCNLVIVVSGKLTIDNFTYKVRDKILTLSRAFEEMVTPDAQDFYITLTNDNVYNVTVIHGKGYNVFKFIINDKNRETAVSH